MDSQTPGTSTSSANIPGAVAPAEVDGLEVITISDNDNGGVPEQQQPFSLNITTTFEQCKQLFGATCHVKLTRCQVPTAAASTTTVKEEDTSDSESSSSEEDPSRTAPSTSAPVPVSNIVPKAEDSSSPGSSSDEDEVLLVAPPSKKPGSKKKRGRKPSGTGKTGDCTICGRTYQKGYLKAHMAIHTRPKKKTEKCEHCGKFYISCHSLKCHKSQNPNGVCKDTDRRKCLRQEKVRQMARKLLEQKWRPKGSWKCKICEKRMKTQCNYQSHMKGHAGERVFKCGQCGKTFPHPTSLSEHLKLHTGVPEFSCVFCEKGFYQKQNLFRHLRSHTEENPYFCEVPGCGASCRDSTSLKTHQRRIHLKKI